MYETVANQYSGKAFRFHMPGHGGINFDSKVFASAPCDITELPFSDNLHNPQSVILDAEKKYSEIYNAKFCQFSTAGATAVLQTAISALKKSSKKMLLQYNSHKSIINACMMFNINFDFFYDLTDLKTKNFSDYSTAIFTSPDYLGRVFENYNEAYKLLKKNNIEIILD